MSTKNLLIILCVMSSSAFLMHEALLARKPVLRVGMQLRMSDDNESLVTF